MKDITKQEIFDFGRWLITQDYNPPYTNFGAIDVIVERHKHYPVSIETIYKWWCDNK